jgi:hypothetical protein
MDEAMLGMDARYQFKTFPLAGNVSGVAKVELIVIQ